MEAAVVPYRRPIRIIGRWSYTRATQPFRRATSPLGSLCGGSECGQVAVCLVATVCSVDDHERPSLAVLQAATDFRSILPNTPATLSPTSVGDAHNWRVFIG